MDQQFDDVLSRLKSLGIEHAAEIRTFRGERSKKDGGRQMITLKLHDAGPAAGPNRFQAEASNDDSKATSGNSGATVAEAFFNLSIHMGKLD